MREIVLATGNPHKVEELRAIMGPLGIPIIGLGELGGSFTEPHETGTTFDENATIKAMSYAAQTGRLCLADDSGIEIDALAGKPGVISSHYSTDGIETGLTRAQRDAANNERVLRELHGVPFEHRAARFVCVMVLAEPPISLVEGRLDSPLIDRGAAGFQPAASPSTPHHPASFPTFDGTFTKQKSHNLPHWQVGNATYFLTFNLSSHAALLTPQERSIILEALKHWNGTRLWLHAAVVMPDHVHALFRPIQQADGSWLTLDGLVHSIKRHTATTINKARDTLGSLWQSEYFDRIIRHPSEMEEAHAYIELNPVRAGLAEKPGMYPWLFRAATHRIDAAEERGGLETRRPECAKGCRIFATTRGTFEGRIGIPPDVPRGSDGFGYDPLFLVAPDFRSTSSQLTPTEKNTRSHRGLAALAMAEWIRRNVN